MSRWSIDVLFSTHASQHASFPSIPLNRHNGHETSTASSSSSVHDVSAIHFACLIRRDLTLILLAYWEGAVLSSLHIVKTSPASPCRLNLFLSPRNSAMGGGWRPMAKPAESGVHRRSWRCDAAPARHDDCTPTGLFSLCQGDVLWRRPMSASWHSSRCVDAARLRTVSDHGRRHRGAELRSTGAACCSRGEHHRLGPEAVPDVDHGRNRSNTCLPIYSTTLASWALQARKNFEPGDFEWPPPDCSDADRGGSRHRSPMSSRSWPATGAFFKFHKWLRRT